jgi:hypothetical protein
MVDKNTITVRELFEKAGYPVPEGARITYGGPRDIYDWRYYRPDSAEHGLPTQLIGEFQWWPTGIVSTRVHWPDLSRLPAIDCIEALPAPLREALEGE